LLFAPWPKGPDILFSVFYHLSSDTNCIKLLRFLYLAQMSGSLEHGAPLELVEGLGMARCSLCKAQLLITIGMTSDF